MSGRTLSRSERTERLAARRKRAKQRLTIALSILGVLVLGGVVWGLWRPALRIRQVSVVSGDPSLASYALTALKGRDFWILPRDSTFFPPEGAIRQSILAAHPEIAAVSVYHTGFDTLGIRVDVRTAVARWCGVASSTPPAPHEATQGTASGTCYFFDPGGFVYEAAPTVTSATSTATTTVAATSSSSGALNDFLLYAPLIGSSTEPVRATILHADALPTVFDFARELASFGSPVVSISMHDGEVDDTLASGSKVMYLLGEEEQAFTALTSAKGQFNLADGSVAYADLRFPGEIYIEPARH